MAKTFKKNCSITQKEYDLLEKIKDRALSKKIILTDSQIVRMGIHLVSNLSDEKIIKNSEEYKINS